MLVMMIPKQELRKVHPTLSPEMAACGYEDKDEDGTVKTRGASDEEINEEEGEKEGGSLGELQREYKGF